MTGSRDNKRAPNTGYRQVEIVHGDEVERPCELLPETAFRGDGQTKADRPALRAMYGVPDDEVGPNSATVRWRFFSCAAGWPDPPGPAEFHEAVRAERPSPRQASVVRAWLQEAPLQEIMLAWIEEAYSWRTLPSLDECRLFPIPYDAKRACSQFALGNGIKAARRTCREPARQASQSPFAPPS